MKIINRSILIFLLTLVLAVVACTISIGGPAYPNISIPVSSEAVHSLQQGIQTAVVEGMQTGRIILVMTEPQLTSYLALKLEEQNEPFITNPQVFLREEQIQIYGTAQQGYFQATARIVLTPGVDDQGKMKIELTSADFGPLPVPDNVREVITSVITEAYTGSLGPIATGFRLDSILIADGTMFLSGRVR